MAKSYIPLKTGQEASYGTSGEAVKALQAALNAKNAGVAGYTPLKVDGLYGDMTKAASTFAAPVASTSRYTTDPAAVTAKTPLEILDANKKTDTTTGGTTTGASTVARYTSPYDTAAKTFYDGLNKTFTPADEQAIRDEKRKNAQAAIDAITLMFDTKRNDQQQVNQNDAGRTRSILAGAGLSGSGRGAAAAEKTDKAGKQQLDLIEQERSAKVAAILADVDDRASQQIEAKRLEAQGNQKAYLDFLQKNNEKAIADVKNLAGLGVLQDQMDPADIQDFLEQTGYSKLELDALWNASLPADKKTQFQTITSPDENGKAKVTRVGYNPITGKTEKQEYVLDVPYDQIATKELKEIDGVLYSVDAKTGKAEALTQPSESKLLDIENKRLQNQKLRSDMSSTGNTSADKMEQRNETLALVNELLSDEAVGKKKSLGAQFTKTGVGKFFVPETLQPDRAAFNARVDSLKSQLTLDNLKLLKGSMSDKDVAFINSVATSLNTNMSAEEFNKELTKIQKKLEKAGATYTPPQDDTQTEDGFTMMTAPDGSQYNVPNANIEVFKQNGYK